MKFYHTYKDADLERIRAMKELPHDKKGRKAIRRRLKETIKRADEERSEWASVLLKKIATLPIREASPAVPSLPTQNVNPLEHLTMAGDVDTTVPMEVMGKSL